MTSRCREEVPQPRYEDVSIGWASDQVDGRDETIVLGYGTVKRPSKRPPINIKRFCGCDELECIVCSKAVSRDVCSSN